MNSENMLLVNRDELHRLLSTVANKCIAKNKPNFDVSIEDALFNDPATIVFWNDGSKTVVKAQNGERFDPEKGLAMAILKRIRGNRSCYNNEFHKWLKNYRLKGTDGSDEDE